MLCKHCVHFTPENWYQLKIIYQTDYLFRCLDFQGRTITRGECYCKANTELIALETTSITVNELYCCKHFERKSLTGDI